jgi:hypothetical protein
LVTFCGRQKTRKQRLSDLQPAFPLYGRAFSQAGLGGTECRAHMTENQIIAASVLSWAILIEVLWQLL